MRTLVGAAVAVLFSTGVAFANPGAVAVAGAAAGAISGSSSESTGVGTGVGVGGDSSSGDVSNKSGSTNLYSGAIGQAPTAVSPSGHCGKGTKFGFGALEWTDYSSKCFNYHLAEIAATQGNWELANQWVVRADDM